MAGEEVERRVSFAEEAVAQIAAVEAALRAAELNLEFTRVIAPISGRVGRAIVTEGNLVSSGPGEGTLLATVVSHRPDVRRLRRRRADVPGAGRRGWVARAAPFRSGWRWPVTISSHARGACTSSTTSSIPRQARSASARSSTTATAPSRQGCSSGLRMPGRRAYKAVLIEDRAVGTDLDKRFVYTVDGKGVIVAQPVTLGPIVEGLRVVRTGVTAGDAVVVNGLQRVRPGVRVQVEQAAAQEAQ